MRARVRIVISEIGMGPLSVSVFAAQIVSGQQHGV